MNRQQPVMTRTSSTVTSAAAAETERQDERASRLQQQQSATRSPSASYPPMQTVTAPAPASSKVGTGGCAACARAHWRKACGAVILLVGAALIVLHLAGYLRPAPPVPTPCSTCTTAFDATNWTRALRRHTRPGYVAAAVSAVPFTAVDYDGMANDADFASFLAAVEAFDIGTLNATAQRAFFINAYNAFTVRMVLRHPCNPGAAQRWCASIRDISQNGGLRTVWKMDAGTIGGHTFSLDNIEHDTLRARWDDARVHAALVCASISCPDLRAVSYDARTLDRALDEQTMLWLANDKKGMAVSTAAGTVTLSKIFDWYAADFKPSVGAFVAQYVAAIWRADVEAASGYQYFDYNWRLNALH